MTHGPRDIFEDVAATLVMAATVMGFTAAHQQWDVWLIGDSRRWTAALLTVLAAAMFGLVLHHIGTTIAGVLAIAALAMIAVAFATESLTALSLLAATVVLAWAIAVLKDMLVAPRAPIPH